MTIIQIVETNETKDNAGYFGGYSHYEFGKYDDEVEHGDRQDEEIPEYEVNFSNNRDFYSVTQKETIFLGEFNV